MPIDRSVCTVCRSPASVKPSYTGYGYCHEHFRSLIERRVRKDLRTNQPIDVRQEYVFKDDGSSRAALALLLLHSIFGGRLALRLDADALPGPLVILPSCVEMDASEQFMRFLAKEDCSLLGIRPLRTVMMDDVLSLSPGGDVVEQSLAHPLLLSLEHDYHGSFFGVLNALGERE